MQANGKTIIFCCNAVVATRYHYENPVKYDRLLKVLMSLENNQSLIYAQFNTPVWGNSFSMEIISFIGVKANLLDL